VAKSDTSRQIWASLEVCDKIMLGWQASVRCGHSPLRCASCIACASPEMAAIGVADLVRDAGRERADRSHFFRVVILLALDGELLLMLFEVCRHVG